MRSGAPTEHNLKSHAAQWWSVAEGYDYFATSPINISGCTLV